jgi:membrane-associated HD superfamily phosphohydrolase
MVVRPFNITEWLVMLMGVLTPFYFLMSYLFLTEKWANLSKLIPDFQLNLPDVDPNLLFFVSIGLVLLILMIGVFYFQDRSRRMLIQVRKNWGVLMVMLFIMLPLPFISENASLDSLLLWVIPVSPFMAMGFLSPKKETFPNIMFWSLMIIIALNNWNIFRN